MDPKALIGTLLKHKFDGNHQMKGIGTVVDIESEFSYQPWTGRTQHYIIKVLFANGSLEGWSFDSFQDYLALV